MDINDPEVQAFIRHSMVARLATLSRSGRPSITPLYFVYIKGHIWFGTVSWTLAAREAQTDPSVSVLFQIERPSNDHRILRLIGRATVRTEADALRDNNRRMALKYILTPGSLRNRVAHWRLLRAVRFYHTQNADKGQPCVIDITPERVEFLDGV